MRRSVFAWVGVLAFWEVLGVGLAGNMLWKKMSIVKEYLSRRLLVLSTTQDLRPKADIIPLPFPPSKHPSPVLYPIRPSSIAPAGATQAQPPFSVSNMDICRSARCISHHFLSTFAVFATLHHSLRKNGPLLTSSELSFPPVKVSGAKGRNFCGAVEMGELSEEEWMRGE
jgi:hypothetical protein